MALDSPERVSGVQLALRLIQPDDADYVFSLRKDPAYNRYLSPVSGSADDQRRWIEAYKEREANGLEAYYIIERLADGRPCGSVRLYGIETDHFTWGSWVLDAGKTPKAALESAVLSFGIGFGVFNKSKALIGVHHDNRRALSFYRRFGMVEMGADEFNIYFIYGQQQFHSDRPKHWQVVDKAGVAARIDSSANMCRNELD